MHPSDPSATPEPLGRQALRAAQEGAPERLAQVLEAGASPHSADTHGDTLLHVLAKTGHTEAFRLVLAHGGCPLKRNRMNYAPIHVAAGYHHTAILEGIAETGADLNTLDLFDRTALGVAAQHGFLDAVELLIARGARLGPAPGATSDESPPLHRAAAAGHMDCLDALLAAGADPNTRHEPTGECALHEAVRHNRLPIALRLIEAGADTQLRNSSGYTPGEMAHRERQVVLAEAISSAQSARRLARPKQFDPAERAATDSDSAPSL